ncbi:hypothetical protein MTO96_032157 [Rhipicephalus appendiculatus]
MRSRTWSAKHDIYTGACTAGIAQWPSRWGLRTPPIGRPLPPTAVSPTTAWQDTCVTRTARHRPDALP